MEARHDHPQVLSKLLQVLPIKLEDLSGNGALWTTIRSQWPPSKLEYYRGKIGEVLECQITQ